MANEQYAFLLRADVPTRAQWQAVIDAAGVDFQLDPELKPMEDSGFSPCRLLGSAAGFEIYYDDSPDFLEEFADIAQGRDCCLSFRWGGSIVEGASAMIASYALAKGFGAIVSYEGEAPESLEALHAGAIEMLEAAKADS